MDRSSLGDALRRVIDHLVGPERSHEIDVGAAAHRRDVGAEVLCQLHGKHPEAAGGAVDQHPFARLQLCLPEEVERARRAHEHGAGFLERHGGGLAREEPVLGHGRELRVGGELVAPRAVDLISRREPRHGCADGFNGAGEIDAQDPVLGAEPGQHANQERAAPEHAIAKAHARGPDADEHLVVGRRRGRDLPDFHDLRRTIARRKRGSHD